MNIGFKNGGKSNIILWLHLRRTENKLNRMALRFSVVNYE